MVGNWIQAFRLRTLPLALSSIFMGLFLAAYNGRFSVTLGALTVFTTILLQILSNLANDYGDSANGADHEKRQGPSRTVQAGLISRRQMKLAMLVFLLLSLISGIVLLYVAFGWELQSFLFFLLLGVLCIIAAITYTVGRKPYGYAGLGDISVLIFFGFVGVMGTYYLQMESIDWKLVFPSLSCGLFSVGVLNLNNIRDIESDKMAGKNSIPVRIGKEKAIMYHWILLVLGLASAIAYMALQGNSLTRWIFLVTFPLFIANALKLGKAKNSMEMDPLLKQLALTTLLFVMTFGVGLIS